MANQGSPKGGGEGGGGCGRGRGGGRAWPPDCEFTVPKGSDNTDWFAKRKYLQGQNTVRGSPIIYPAHVPTLPRQT